MKDSLRSLASQLQEHHYCLRAISDSPGCPEVEIHQESDGFQPGRPSYIQPILYREDSGLYQYT